MVKPKIKKTDGAISIIFIVLTLILITIITAFLTLNKTSFLFNEIQSVMDTSATTSLVYSIDKNKLKQEIIAVGDSYIYSDGSKKNINQSQLDSIIKQKYIEQLNANISTGNIDGVNSYKIVSFSTELTYDDWGVNATTNNVLSRKKRPQLIMNSVVQVTVDSYTDFDTLGTYTLNLYNARTSKNDISISVAGTTNDGKIILNVRTMARVVYR